MRALLLLTLLAGPASADIGVGLAAQATRYGDRPYSTVGAAVELSIDRPRWQYFAELSASETRFDDEAAGAMVRGGLGVRHVARRFSIRDRLDFELGFEALVAMQDIAWRGRAHERRPELAAGFSWTFVFFRTVASRTSVRAFFTPAPTGDLACRGSCAHDAITPGYMVVTGVVW